MTRELSVLNTVFERAADSGFPPSQVDRDSKILLPQAASDNMIHLGFIQCVAS